MVFVMIAEDRVHATPACQRPDLDPATYGWNGELEENARVVCFAGESHIFDYARVLECLCNDVPCPCGAGSTVKLAAGDLLVSRGPSGPSIRTWAKTAEPWTLERDEEHFRQARIIELQPWEPGFGVFWGESCFRLPEGNTWNRDHVYFVNRPWAGTTLVNLRPPRRASKPEPPRFKPLGCSVFLAFCHRYGAMRFQPIDRPNFRFHIWEVQTPDGNRIAGPYIGQIPMFSSESRVLMYNSGKEGPKPSPLKTGGEYIFIAREIGIDGDLSEPTRVPFKLKVSRDSLPSCDQAL